MKLITKIYRVTTIRTGELLAAVGKDPETVMSGDELMSLVKINFKPMAPRFVIFYPKDTSFSKTIVGMEAINFDILEAKVPMAGLVTVDPIDPGDVHRVDGAIESELNRLGIGTDFANYEWRAFYEINGN